MKSTAKAPASQAKKTASAKAQQQAVVPKKQTAVAATEADDAFGEHEGVGHEHITSRDLIIPRLAILQGLSPQINPKKPEYIRGATMGQICDIGTGELFEGEIEFLPVYYIRQWLEWSPRDSGRGLVAIHDTDELMEQTEKDDNGKNVLPNGNHLVETAQFYGLNMTAGRRKSFLPMSSTQLKKAKKLLNFSMNERRKRSDGTEYTPPLYYRVYKLGSIDESNPKGDWIGWTIERGEALPEYAPEDWRDIVADCVAFREQLARGEAKGDVASMGGEQSEGGEAAM